MSYAMAAALQAAVFAALHGDPEVMALSGGAIHDALPPGPVAPLFVVIGPEEARDASDQTGMGAVHDFTVTVTSSAAGFVEAKQLAAAVSNALSGADLILSRGRLVALRFLRARARRVDGAREIELSFRALLDADA